MITVSGLFYCGWVLSLFQSGNLERLGHLALTFAAQGTIIFRLLLISGPTPRNHQTAAALEAGALLSSNATQRACPPT